MRVYIYLLLFILSGCKPEAPVDNSVQEDIDFTTMQLTTSNMTLVGKAQQKSLKWVAYQKLLTEFENFDHSIAATNRLIDHVDKMLETPEEAFNDQAILSRIKILKTRLSIYKSYLGYRIKTNDTLEKKYNEIITSLDEVKVQMNWKVNDFDGNNRKLLEDLKADLDPDQV